MRNKRSNMNDAMVHFFVRRHLVRAACVLQTGSQNVFVVDGRCFMWEESHKEHADGAITGAVYRFNEAYDPRSTASASVTRAGTFRINGDGTIARAPKWAGSSAMRRSHTITVRVKIDVSVTTESAATSES
jgi:hypothetical protein